MKTIGLVGCMDWHAANNYFQVINQATQQHLGHEHSAQCVMVNIDFAHFNKLHNSGQDAVDLVVRAAQRAEKAGADIIVLCATAIHHHVLRVEAACSIPVLHIADAVGQELLASGVERVGLLGNRYVMEGGDFRDRLEQNHGLQVIVPRASERQFLEELIFEHLVLDDLEPEPPPRGEQIINDLIESGVETIVFGAPQLSLILSRNTLAIPCFDAHVMHAVRAVDWALAD